jgi:hypothetical protein
MNIKKMKRVFIIMVLLTFVSCKTSKGGHCEAYGKVTEKEKKDLVLR